MSSPPIPQHIMEAALACWDELDSPRWPDAHIPVIARHILAAVMAERAATVERCAKIAETWVELPSIQDGNVGCITAYSEGIRCGAPAGISKTIRSGGQTP